MVVEGGRRGGHPVGGRGGEAHQLLGLKVRHGGRRGGRGRGRCGVVGGGGGGGDGCRHRVFLRATEAAGAVFELVVLSAGGGGVGEGGRRGGGGGVLLVARGRCSPNSEGGAPHGVKRGVEAAAHHLRLSWKKGDTNLINILPLLGE